MRKIIIFLSITVALMIATINSYLAENQVLIVLFWLSSTITAVMSGAAVVKYQRPRKISFTAEDVKNLNRQRIRSGFTGSGGNGIV